MQIQQISHSNMTREFDFLGSSPLINLHEFLDKLVKVSRVSTTN